MHRIILVLATAALLLSVGCESQQGGRGLRPLPDPVLSTRPPERIEPIPPPKPTPAPEPLPDVGAGLVRLRDIMPAGGIQRGKWQVIVVHHSAARNSTPQGMDAWHRQRGWAGGLGYHFVIGNGVNYPDGQLYVGPRWKSQSTGAHCKNAAGRYLGVWRDRNYFNDRGIGICLIGNFQSESPTPRQLATLRDLTALLVQQTSAAPSAVWGHGEITHKTECPGRNMNMGSLRRSVAAAVGAAPPAAMFDLIDERMRFQLAVDEPCDDPCCGEGEPDLADGDVKAINVFN